MTAFAQRSQAFRARVRPVAAPELSLLPDGYSIDAGESICVAVNFTSVEDVALTIEPRDAFSIDMRELSKPGTVRLKGILDGPATLIARGRLASGEGIERQIHVECVGPLLRLLGCGYIPAV
ncbi:MAG: hypothetical protein ACYS22_05700 [Planctomycetota bacterium]|jgi:hypothetical protein